MRNLLINGQYHRKEFFFKVGYYENELEKEWLRHFKNSYVYLYRNYVFKSL